MNQIYKTPELFLTKTNHNYPPNNFMVFEEFFFNKFKNETRVTNIKYLPVQWTCFYISRNYLSDPTEDLQQFLNEVPSNEKLFTVVQWDDGIRHNISNLNLYSFASGGIGDYPIPLICCPVEKIERPRDIFASFIGVIGGRHDIREQLYGAVHNKEGFILKERTNYEDFKQTMEKSIFSLCPRGYGRTSFRICESLNLGSIPVYIYDTPWIPFQDLVDFNSYGVLVHQSEINKIGEILHSYNEDDIKRLQENGKKVFEELYTYEGCYENIIKC